MNWRINHKQMTVSTNLDAQKGRPGDVFTADFQTAGRGRLDHKWLSAPGENLMMSAVLDVEGLSPEHVVTLPLVVGLAVLRGLSPFVSPSSVISLKWPNDILVDGRKLSGILCERHGDCVIAGLGVNVLQRKFAKEIENRAISLSLLGSVPSIAEVRDAILASLGELYEVWRTQGFDSLYPAIAAHDYLRGQTLGVLQTDDDTAPVRGLCGGIQPDGSLLVGDTPIYAGEAHILP